METILHEDDWAKMKCSQGHIFEVDPHTERNLYWDEQDKVLKAECPKCGEKE